MHTNKFNDDQTNILLYDTSIKFNICNVNNSIQAMTIYKNQMLKRMHTGSSLKWYSQYVSIWKQISWAILQS